MKTKMELTEEHILKTYKPQMIESDMLAQVILHDAYQRYLFNPNDTELKWLICRLRFVVADDELKEEIRKQDDIDFNNWIYNQK